MKKLFFFTVFLVSLFSVAAHGATFTRTVTLSEPLPLAMETGVRYNVNVDFGYRFRSISRVCFRSYFVDDLADSGETFFIGPFGNSSFGWTNVSSTSLSSRQVCITTQHSEIREFMDGVQNFDIRMSSGQAKLSSFEVIVTGEADEPPVLPKHSVSILIDDGEEAIPASGGRLQYSALIENKDIDNASNDLRQWSVLTFPSGEDYSVHKANTVTLGLGEVKEYLRPRLRIPSWFPAGIYTFTWYVADPDNEANTLLKDTFVFQKLAQ